MLDATGENENGFERATTEWCEDLCWRDREREGLLPMGATNRLANAGRALHGARTIAKMLVEDRRGKLHASEEDGIHYCGLTSMEIEGLGVAMLELMDCAGVGLEQVRDNHLGHLGKPR